MRYSCWLQVEVPVPAFVASSDTADMSAWRRLVRQTTMHASPPGPVVVDITGLDFISGTALEALADRADVCREQGIHLVVVSRASIVRRVAAATGLDEHLTIHSSVDGALRAGESENSAATCRGGNPSRSKFVNHLGPL